MLDRQTATDAACEVTAVEARGGNGDTSSSAAHDIVGGTIERLTRENQQRIKPVLLRIERLIVRVVYTHGLGHGQLAALAYCYVDLANRLDEQMRKEETELFPALLAFGESQHFEPTQGQCRKRLCELEDDHYAVAGIFDRIRAITDNYQSPPGACRRYGRLLQALSSLDATLWRHWDVEEQLLLDLTEIRQHLKDPTAS